MEEAAKNEIKKAIKAAAKNHSLGELDNPYERIAAELPARSFEGYFPEIENESLMTRGARIEEEINEIWSEI